MYPSVQATIWGNVGKVTELLDTVLDCFIKVFSHESTYINVFPIYNSALIVMSSVGISWLFTLMLYVKMPLTSFVVPLNCSAQTHTHYLLQFSTSHVWRLVTSLFLPHRLNPRCLDIFWRLAYASSVNRGKLIKNFYDRITKQLKIGLLQFQASATGGLGSVKAEVMADTAVALASANVQVVSRKVIGRLDSVRRSPLVTDRSVYSYILLYPVTDFVFTFFFHSAHQQDLHFSNSSPRTAPHVGRHCYPHKISSYAFLQRLSRW